MAVVSALLLACGGGGGGGTTPGGPSWHATALGAGWMIWEQNVQEAGGYNNLYFDSVRIGANATMTVTRYARY